MPAIADWNTQIMTALCKVEAGGEAGLFASDLNLPMSGVLTALGWVRKDEIRGVYFLTPEGRSEAERWRNGGGQGALLSASDPVRALVHSVAREFGLA